MGLLDKIKGALQGKGKQVNDGIDKAADVADDKTDGKYTEQIDGAADKAKDVVDKLDEA
jgi:ABC-type transporter Mla subunit MlaD